MRVAAAVLAGFGALVSLYVPLEAFQNNFGTGLPSKQQAYLQIGAG